MQKETNQPLTCWFPEEEYDVIATLPRHISDTDYDTTAVVLKPRDWRSGYILVIREKAMGGQRDKLVKKAGLPYWNHAIYLRINLDEVERLKSICDDADNYANNFAEYYAKKMKKAFSVKPNEDSIMYAFSVHGGNNEDVLKGYITLQPVGCDYFKIRKLYDLWAWTRIK